MINKDILANFRKLFEILNSQFFFITTKSNNEFENYPREQGRVNKAIKRFKG